MLLAQSTMALKNKSNVQTFDMETIRQGTSTCHIFNKFNLTRTNVQWERKRRNKSLTDKSVSVLVNFISSSIVQYSLNTKCYRCLNKIAVSSRQSNINQYTQYINEL